MLSVLTSICSTLIGHFGEGDDSIKKATAHFGLCFGQTYALVCTHAAFRQVQKVVLCEFSPLGYDLFQNRALRLSKSVIDKHPFCLKAITSRSRFRAPLTLLSLRAIMTLSIWCDSSKTCLV